MDAIDITAELLFNAFKIKGHLLTDFNIIGVRFNDNIDLFTDLRIVLRKVGGAWEIKRWNQTTKPGKSALLKPVNPAGCANVKEGQYINAWQQGLHHNHPALIQCAPIIVGRDNKKDGTDNFADWTEEKAGAECGINLHSVWAANIPNWDGTYPSVGNWSEGCQVMARPSENLAFLEMCKASGLKWFTYTLFNINDLTKIKS